MKLLLLSLVFLASCAGNNLTPKILIGDMKNVALAGGIGYLEGGKVGAALNMSKAEIANLKRLSAKNPKLVNP